MKICNTTILGYVTGKMKATVPWAKLSQSPSSWISPDCAPDGFLWADPSKIRIDGLYDLLDHWRDRELSGLEPLIWAPSCPLLSDVEDPSEHSQCSNEETSTRSFPGDNLPDHMPSDGNHANSEIGISNSHPGSNSGDDLSHHGDIGDSHMESPPHAGASSYQHPGMTKLFLDLIALIFGILY